MNKTFDQVVSIQPRFHRSVDLVQDLGSDGSLDGYIVTPQAAELAARIATGLATKGDERAWTLTGPYGAGKSAFALFVATVVSPRDVATRKLAHRALCRDTLPPDAARLATRVAKSAGYFVVPVGGSREPIVPALLRAIGEAIEKRFDLRRTPWKSIAADISALSAKRKNSKASERDFLAILERVQEGVAEEALDGTFIVVDELGKFLEFAAENSHADVYVLQLLAERSARSVDRPLGVLTVLHQAFDRYAATVSQSVRVEWQKIQGRFADVAFVDKPAEILQLVAAAIDLDPAALPELAPSHTRLIRDAVTAAGFNESELGLLRRMLPLHPVAARVLPGLFRSALAQNERSLFSFLSSAQPYGFTSFLRERMPAAGVLYRLDDLYDYVLSTLGPALLASTDSKRWSEVISAVDRISSDAPSFARRIVKTIGMLSILGSIPATKECLSLALFDSSVPTAELTAQLDWLVSQSIVVFRRHKNAYGLWEGSDIDLDREFARVRAHAATPDLLDAIRDRIKQHPIAARGHFFRSGTLRYFDVEVATLADVDQLAAKVESTPTSSDGRIVYLLPSGDVSLESLVKIGRKFTGENPRIVLAVPKNAAVLLDAAAEHDGYFRLRETLPELAGDSVARRELSARLAFSRERLDAAIAAAFGGAERSAATAAIWVSQGVAYDNLSAAALAKQLSAVCDRVFHAAPRIHNELLNRRHLSSAAAAARRTLVERMLTEASSELLGIEGFPPERNMYASVLLSSGLHTTRESGLAFGPPSPEDPQNFQPFWSKLDSLFGESEEQSLPLETIRSALASPPFGIKEGVIWVLLFAVIAASPAEFAVFEENTFYPELSSALIERMLRRPGSFSISRFRLDPSRTLALKAIANALGLRAEEALPIPVLRVIVRRRNALPKFAQITRTVDQSAIALREAIATALHPMLLLFRDLPRAVGFETPSVDLPPEEAANLYSNYAATLVETLRHLENAYPSLLKRIQQSLASHFHLTDDSKQLRLELNDRARRIQLLATEPRLRSFIIRACDVELSDVAWIESLATILIVPQRPPAEWTDADFARFSTGLSEIRSQFLRTEDLSMDDSRDQAAPSSVDLVRISVTTLGRAETRQVVPIPTKETDRMKSATMEIRSILDGQFGKQRELWLATLGRILREVADAEHDVQTTTRQLDTLGESKGHEQ